MSRSRRKTKITGFAVCDSEKDDKKIGHRAFRRAANQSPFDAEALDERMFSSPWRMGKDGKHYWPEMPEYLMRK